MRPGEGDTSQDYRAGGRGGRDVNAYLPDSEAPCTVPSTGPHPLAPSGSLTRGGCSVMLAVTRSSPRPPEPGAGPADSLGYQGSCRL